MTHIDTYDVTDCYGGFQSHGGSPIAGRCISWLIRKNLIRVDDWGVPPWRNGNLHDWGSDRSGLVDEFDDGFNGKLGLWSPWDPHGFHTVCMSKSPVRDFVFFLFRRWFFGALVPGSEAWSHVSLRSEILDGRQTQVGQPWNKPWKNVGASWSGGLVCLVDKEWIFQKYGRCLKGRWTVFLVYGQDGQGTWERYCCIPKHLRRVSRFNNK